MNRSQVFQSSTADRLVISQATVREALKNLLYSSSPTRQSPLEHLWLIDQCLLAPNYPVSPHNRAFALQSVLTTTITDELRHHRKVLGLPPLDDSSTRGDALTEIAQEAQSGSIELIGWSWLYHRYVRVDLNLTTDEFCHHANLEPRTRRRYQDHAIRRLTERLLEQERVTRVALHRHRLYAQLPQPYRVRLFGREEAMVALRRITLSRPPHIIQVTGAAGVGKTALVQEWLRDEIDSGALAHVLWVHQPSSVDEVVDRLSNSLPNISLRDRLHFFEANPTALVLDGLDTFANTMDDLAATLDWLAPVTTYIIHTSKLPLSRFSGAVELNTLSPKATESMIRFLAETYAFSSKSHTLSEADIRVVMAEAEGYPHRVQRELQRLLEGE